MAFPAPSTPTEQWLYISNTVAILGNNTTINPNPTLVEDLLCYAYSQGYTGLFLYQMNSAPWRSSGSATTFDMTNAKAKIADFVLRARAKGIDVGLVTDSKPAWQDCLVDYNNTRTNPDEKITAMAIENEWYWWSYDNAATLSVVTGPGQAGTYSFTSMKSNLVSKKAALNAQGILSYLYYGWPRANGYVYNTVAGQDGSTVSGGSEIAQLQGVVDKHMIHKYYQIPTYDYGNSSRPMSQFTYPVDILWIVSAEVDFADNFFEGKQAPSGTTVIYPKKNAIDAYKYLTVDTNALGYTPAQVVATPRYFNAETNATVQANVNLVGITIFHYNHILALDSGNGPRIWIQIGDDITNNTIPGTVAVGIISSVCDDGLPTGRSFTYQWSVQSGPSGSSFSAPTSTSSNFSYIAAGAYVIRLTVTDGVVTSYDEQTIFVQAIGATKLLTFDSQTPGSGAAITLSVADLNGDQNGSTSFTRLYNESTILTATAASTAGGNNFLKWQRDGLDYSFSPALSITDNQPHTYTAIYSAVLPPLRTVEITANFPASTFTVNVPDIYGNPVGLTGVSVSHLHYYEGQLLTITAPATHPVNGATFLHFFVHSATVVASTTLNYTVVDPTTGVFPQDNNIILVYDNSDIPTFSAIPTVQDQYCPGLGGETRITVLDAETYTYLWSNGVATAVNASPGVGTYSCTVTCTSGVNIGDIIIFTNMTVSSPVVVTAFTSVIAATCSTPNGSALVTATGGSAPYTYLWSNGATTRFINAIAGAYTVVVTDNNSCSTAPIAAVITSGSDIVQDSVDIIQMACTSIPLGTITIEVSGGVLPYTFLWTKAGDPGFSAPNSNQITGLSAGDYSVLVTDDNACSNGFGPFTIDVQDPLVVTASTHLGATICSAQEITLYIDSITIGGSPVTPSSILWSTGGTAMTDVLGYLIAGSYSYSVLVLTSTGCSATATVNFDVIASPTTPLVVTLVTAPSACLATNYELSVAGTGSYLSFEWVPTGDVTTTITHLSSSILVPTEFYVIGYGVGGCSIESNRITVNPSLATTISITTQTNNACGGIPNGGAIDITVTGGCAPYTYAWTGPGGFVSALPDISGLINGVYTLLVTDSLLDTDTVNVTIVTSSPTITGATVDTGCAGVNNGEILVGVTGGTLPYQYLWSNGATTATITGLSTGAYTVVVTDANGCTDTETFFVGAVSPVNVSFRTRNPSPGFNNGEITAIPTGGRAPYTYLWSTAETTATIVNLAEGRYDVLVTDVNGCPCNGTVYLLSDTQETLENLRCCAGDLAYLYVWQMQGGLAKEAKCTMARLKLLNGYIKDICNYEADTCLTSTQYDSIFEKAKYICGCCACSSDIYDDTLLP